MGIVKQGVGMVIESSAQLEKGVIFATCEEVGEPGVLADLERANEKFTTQKQKNLAWEWVYFQRIKREEATKQALRDAAWYTMLVAVATFLVALFTAGVSVVQIFLGH